MPAAIRKGSVIIWTCISVSGVWDPVKIHGIMNAENNHQIFFHRAAKSFIFLHDNDPKHTAYLDRKQRNYNTLGRGLASPQAGPQHY